MFFTMATADQPTTSAHIRFVNRTTKQVEIEKVYGDRGVRFLYETGPGYLLERALLSRHPLSVLYGLYNDSALSAARIAPFVRDYGIDLSLFEVPVTGFHSFNEFFIRRYKSGQRPFPQDAHRLGSPAEGRVLAYENIDPDSVFAVKGQGLSLTTLLQNVELAQSLKGGTGFVLRLCPVDYHRYHFPDSGTARAAQTVTGRLHSVNPVALRRRPLLFQENQRVVTVFESDHFGKIVFVEVGALMVGRMTQTYAASQPVLRGQEKGYFTFGASTVLVFIEPKRLKIDEDLIENTKRGLETYVKLGEPLGTGQVRTGQNPGRRL